MSAGADTSSRTRSFVCQTTPHFDSTSREVSYSVLPYHTRETGKSKSLFYPFLSISATQTEEPAGEWEFLVNLMKKLSKLVEIYLLFVRFPFIMNTICYKGGVGVGRTDRVCVR